MFQYHYTIQTNAYNSKINLIEAKKSFTQKIIVSIVLEYYNDHYYTDQSNEYSKQTK